LHGPFFPRKPPPFIEVSNDPSGGSPLSGHNPHRSLHSALGCPKFFPLRKVTRMIDWTRIETFIGFGRPEASVYFIGLEEGLQRSADLTREMEERSSYEQFMDLAEVQVKLGESSIYFGEDAVSQRTWRPMCDLMLRKSGAIPTLAARRKYQAERLGRRDGDTLLAELLPYPHSDTSQWLYADLSRFASREDYELELLPKRIALLRQLIDKYCPDIVVCYGKSQWVNYKKLFDVADWQVQGTFEVAHSNAMRVVLAHHLSGKTFNRDQQLEQFASVALDE
jgi:hypothetical protein